MDQRLNDAIVGLAAAHKVFVPIIEAAGINWEDAIGVVRWKDEQ